MKKLWGNFILLLSKGIEKLFDGLIFILSFIVDLLSGISRYLVGLAAAMLLIGTFLIPFIIIFLLVNPLFWMAIFVFFIVPFLGRKFISFLKYSQYIICEYLNNYGFYLVGKRENYTKFSEFTREYERKREDEQRRKREERQRQEQREWEERFKEWNSFFSNGNGNTYYGNFNGYSQYQNAYNNFSDPYNDFREKFEKSCRILEFNNFDVDFYQVKLQYRKLAKKYHPDLNRDVDTTEKFQEINSAFEFLTEENIKRYKEIIKR